MSQYRHRIATAGRKSAIPKKFSGIKSFSTEDDSTCDLRTAGQLTSSYWEFLTPKLGWPLRRRSAMILRFDRDFTIIVILILSLYENEGEITRILLLSIMWWCLPHPTSKPKIHVIL